MERGREGKREEGRERGGIILIPNLDRNELK